MDDGRTIAEPMEVHKTFAKGERRQKVMGLMEKVGLSSDQINRYPHEFSGGQRQRIGIARALATNPEFVVADESYTEALLSAVPIPDPKKSKRGQILMGDIPSPINPPSCSRFHTHCPHVMLICKEVEPDMIGLSDSHQVACYLCDK